MLRIMANRGRLDMSGIKVKHYLLFALIWLGYATLSLVWAGDRLAAMREIVFLFMGVSLILLVVFYFNDIKDLTRFFDLWILVLAAMICVGLWEYATGSHLIVSTLAHAERITRAPTAVFGNQNDYATYLVLSIPFLISFVRYSRQYHKRLLGVAMLIASIFLLVATLSRANYIAIAAGAAFWFFFLLRARGKIKTSVVICLFVLLAFAAAQGTMVRTIGNQLQTVTAELSQHTELNSIQVRLNLARNCLGFLVDSGGFGVGAGNTEYHMENFQVYDTGGIVNAHNWWLEILTNYGLFIFAGYMLFYLGILISLLRVSRTLKDHREKMLCEALLVATVVFPIAAFSSSTIMAQQTPWLFFAFLLGFLNYC
ncbi:MAG: O-antigen ligase family protein, partial [candidate division Zixibacteria bacterium]|nr:O-antigen ligase family protein [candidate division Zixibacteria bacterium]